MPNYPNAEKIIERCLEHPLNDIEQKEVRQLLKALEDAGWPVEETPSAPFIAIVGFFYARAPKPFDDTLLEKQFTEKIGAAVNTVFEKPIVHLDFVATFKEVLTKSFTTGIRRLGLFTTGALLAIAIWGTHQFDMSYMQNGQQAIQTK